VKRLVLIGSRGAGKTTIGRRVALRLGLPFLDLDDLALARTAAGSVREVFRVAGETAWRAAEAAAAAETLAGSPTGVLALGGGAVTVPAIRTVLADARRRDAIRVAYLEVRPEILAERLRADPGDRSSLTGKPLADEIDELLRAREPLYRSLADRIEPASDRPVEAIAAALAAFVRDDGRGG